MNADTANSSCPARVGRADTRSQLLQVGAELISTQGYNNTGIKAILDAAGVPKGSFYYYFASKEDFGLAVIEHFNAQYQDKLDRVLDDETVAPLERLNNYLEAGIAEMSAGDFTRGCLMGNLAQELAGQNEAFRERLQQVFSGWTARFAECLAAARRRGELAPHCEPEQLAEFLLVGWEGAVLRAKVTRDLRPMQAFRDTFFERVLERA